MAGGRTELVGWARSQRSATRRERGGLGTSVWDGVYFHRPRSAFSASDLTSKALNPSSTSRRWRGQCIFTTLPFHADKQQRPTEQWCPRWCPHTLSPPLSALAPDRSRRRGPWHPTPLGIHARDPPTRPTWGDRMRPNYIEHLLWEKKVQTP